MGTPVIESGFFAGLPDTSSPEYAAEHRRGGGKARAPRRDPATFIGPPPRRPTSAHKAKAAALYAKHPVGDDDFGPEDIADPQVREAYTDLLHEEAFGAKPSYRPEGSRQRADRQHREAIAAGEIPDDTQTPGRAVPGATGGAAAGTRPPSRPAGRSSSASSWGGQLAGSDGTGLLLGFLLYSLGLNYLRYGPAGITGWLSAKFLNKPNPALAAGNPLSAGSPATTPTPSPFEAPTPIRPVVGGNGSPTGGGSTGF